MIASIAKMGSWEVITTERVLNKSTVVMLPVASNEACTNSSINVVVIINHTQSYRALIILIKHKGFFQWTYPYSHFFVNYNEADYNKTILQDILIF